MKHAPTFEMLRERREMCVRYPPSGLRFIISLRDWQGALWAVKVIPQNLRREDRKNPFVTNHRIMTRLNIVEWLERLSLN